ncbi:ribonuclease T2 family protein [Jannaschia aquimarina]|uniref:Ribonuclease I n=1 Tax=Jannaschia aquimarina TaxID=935700 RepID=A0A0D1DAW0_9RHOB|nr:ribonuclease T2 [Jannaschia aquimarina]KIT17078.1 ribonuclease I [Jannaschia aquimarina]SNS46283.1 ribonuclease T2 [Jannaschia aquimarina]
MRAMLLAVLAALAGPTAADEAGTFDYYVLALSWSPNWCAAEGDARGAEQCGAGQGLGWTLHGLWPQYERGWPADCSTSARPPSRQRTAAEADIYGSAGLAWHQWRKHGTCSGLAPGDYYRLARLAYERIERPEILRQLDREVTLPASVIEDAFLEVNPALGADGLTVTCRGDRIQEVRICLTRDLEPRRCGSDVRSDCTLPDAGFAPVR